MVQFLKLLTLPLAVVCVMDVSMYLVARRALARAHETWYAHFRFHKGEFAWVNAYLRFARSRGLPTWMAYVNRGAWFSIVGIAIYWWWAHLRT